MTKEFVDPEDEEDLNRILLLKSQALKYTNPENKSIVESDPRLSSGSDLWMTGNTEGVQPVMKSVDSNVMEMAPITDQEENPKEVDLEECKPHMDSQKEIQEIQQLDMVESSQELDDSISIVEPSKAKVNAFEMMLRKRKPEIITVDDDRKRKRSESKGKEREIIELSSNQKGKQRGYDSKRKGKEPEIIDLEYDDCPTSSKTKINPFFMSKKERKEQLMIENQIKLQLSIKKNQQISAEISVGKSTNPFFQPKKYLTSTIDYHMENLMPSNQITHIGYTKSAVPVLRDWIWKPKEKSVPLVTGEFEYKIDKRKPRVKPISIYTLDEILVYLGDLIPEHDLTSSWIKPYYNSLIEGESVTPEGLWIDYFKPTKIKQVIGNQNQQVCKEIRDWIKYWKPKKKIDDFEEDEGDLLFIHGPVGSGKTTLPQMVCKQMGIDVIELDTSMVRTQKLFENVAGNSVVLVDDVDVVMYQDKGFWQGIETLKTKTRVILTSTFLLDVNAKYLELDCRGVDSWIRVVCACLGYWVEGNLEGDKRSLLNMVQFESRGIPREFGGVKVPLATKETGEYEFEKDEMIPLMPKLVIPEPYECLLEEEEEIIPRKHKKLFKENYLWDIPYMGLMCGKFLGRRKKSYLYWLDINEIEHLQTMYS
ncbi:hypothetical protein HDV04_005167 [Boothiomyces sp. JEL0838]|nr:hypothetical protein HDV04_005167 [Boothiomyces sp. JEL0838]